MASDAAILLQELENCKAKLKIESRRNSTWCKAYERLKADLDRVVMSQQGTMANSNAHARVESSLPQTASDFRVGCDAPKESGLATEDNAGNGQQGEVQQLQKFVSRLTQNNRALEDRRVRMERHIRALHHQRNEERKEWQARNAFLEEKLAAKNILLKQQTKALMQLRHGALNFTNKKKVLKASRHQLDRDLFERGEKPAPFVESETAQDSMAIQRVQVMKKKRHHSGVMMLNDNFRSALESCASVPENAMDSDQNGSKDRHKDLKKLVDVAVNETQIRIQHASKKQKQDIKQPVYHPSIISFENRPAAFTEIPPVQSRIALQQHFREDFNQVHVQHSALPTNGFLKESPLISARASSQANKTRNLKESVEISTEIKKP